MNTAEKLSEFYDFSPEVVDRVSETMERISSFDTYKDFFAATGVTAARVYFDGYKPSRVLDTRPDDYDETEAISVSLAMGQPFDDNNIYQVAAVAAHFPDKRVVAFSNPCGINYHAGRARFSHLPTIWRGDVTPLIDTELKYYDAHHVERVYKGAYSYGIEKALAATVRSGHDTPAIALIEPASVIPRSLKELGDAFSSTEPALEGYVNASDLPTFLDARANSINKYNYIVGLARPTNIAIARSIGRGLFGIHANDALIAQPDMQMTVAWGSDSELAVDVKLQENIEILRSVHGDHVRAMRMIGHRHALGDMLPVKLAIMDEAFSLAA